MKISLFPKGDLDAIVVYRSLTVPEWIRSVSVLAIDGVELYSGMFDTNAPNLGPAHDVLAETGLEMPIVAKAVTMYGGFSHTWDTWERVLALFASGQLNPETVLDGSYPLENWKQGFEAMETGTNIKSVVTFGTAGQKTSGD